MVNGQQNAIAAALIDAIHMHKTFSYELRLHPFALYQPQDPLGRRRTHTVSLSNLCYSLLIVQVQSPYLSFIRSLSRRPELMTANQTFVQLNPIAFAVTLGN